GYIQPDLASWEGRHPTHEELVPLIKDGLLFCSFIEGLLQCELKGIHRRPKQRAAFLHNWNKALARLRDHPKINIRHLWDTDQLATGDTGVFFELLFDVSEAFQQSGKGADRSDPRGHTPAMYRPGTTGPGSALGSGALCAHAHNTMRPDSSTSHLAMTRSSSSLAPINIHTTSQAALNIAGFPSDRPSAPGTPLSLDSLNHHKSSPALGIHLSPALGPSDTLKSMPRPGPPTDDTQNAVRDWLDQLGFTPPEAFTHVPHPLQDPYRNGHMLCSLAETLLNELDSRAVEK
ncbi:hypothetical protein KIPB_010171, partial [Kipferlia bialata]